MQQYRVNYRLLIGLAIGLLVISAATFFLHRYQLDRNADILIASGEKAQKSGDLKSAVREYSNYLSIRRDDEEARVKLANLWADILEQPKFDPEDFGNAIGYMEEIVRTKPEEKALQVRLVELYGRFGQVQPALDHLSQLLQKYPDDAELQVKQMEFLLAARKLDGPDGALALCKKLIGYDDKTDSFDDKKAIAPHDASAYANCAVLLRSVQDKPELAARVMDQLVKVNPELPQAYLQRGQYYVSTGEPSRGQRDIDKAYQLAPKDANVLLMKASRAEANKRPKKAREYLEAGKKEHPEDARFYQGLAGLEMKDQKYTEALAIFDEGLKAVPASEARNLLFYKSDLQLMASDVEGVRRTEEDMRKAGVADVFIDWIEARILMIQNRFYEAGEALAAVQAKFGDGGPYADTLAMQLGLAYEKSGQRDKAQTVYQGMLKRNPNNEPAKDGMKRVALMGGRPEKSATIEDLDQLVEQVMRLPKDQRDWTKIDEQLTKLAEERKYEGATLDLFWAQMLLAREDFAGARKRLVAGRDKDPDNLQIQRLAVGLLRAEDPQQGPAKALRLLGQVVERFGDKPELRLDRADCLIAQNQQKRDDEQLKKELSALSQLPEAWSESDQVTFWNGMAARYLQLGMRDEAKSSLGHVIALRPKELPTRMALFSLALEANDDVAMKDAQDQILNIVGSKENSNWLYCEARRMLSLFRRGELDQDSLDNIQQLADRAIKDRPNWFELHILSAELALLKGDQREALAHFEKAEELGRPNGNALLLHVRLLLQDGKYKAARDLIEQFPPNVREGDLGQVYAEVLFSTGDIPGAVDVITKFAEAAPSSADRQLIMGQMLARASSAPGQPEASQKEWLARAGESLEQAVTLAPESQQTWLALLTYQVLQKDLEAAKHTMQRAQLALPEDQAVGVLAKGNEILGQWFDAENVYLTTLENQPDNLLLVQELATFYLSQNYPRPDKLLKATQLVNRILHAGADGKLKPDDPSLMWARRTAAQILADTGDYQQLRKAENLLASNAQNGALPAEDRLRMAQILAARPDPISRRKAKSLFEQIQKDQPLSLQDDMRLGQLYFALGEWDRCKRQMQQTIARNQKAIEPRALYVTMILQRGNEADLSEAVRQGAKLRELAPNDSRTIQLMAQLGGKTGKQQQVRTYLRGMLPKVDDPQKIDEKQIPLMEFVAALLVSVDDLDTAENVYRAIAARDPNRVLALVSFLGIHRDVAESMELLEKAYQPDLTEPISRVALGVIRARRDEVGDKFDRQLRGWIDRGLLENPESISLLMLQAEFADLTKDYDTAAEIYKKLLTRSDVTGVTRAIVLNNLAFLVALAGNEDEAGVDPLKLVQEAAQILGPTADVLDTEAVIYTTRGEYQKAIRDLENSLTDNPTAAKHFHKAVAHLGAGENTAAIKSWDEAQKLDKDVRSTLNRMEFESYDRTKAKIDEIRRQSQSLTRAAG